MNLTNLYKRCKDEVSRSSISPEPGERYYDVLRGSEVVIETLRKDGSVIVIRYKDDDTERPFSEGSWRRALKTGRFETCD